jgi:hypothetical protein
MPKGYNQLSRWTFIMINVNILFYFSLNLHFLVMVAHYEQDKNKIK